MHPKPELTLPGQESVWSYPRPPVLEPTPRRLRIVHQGFVVADTARGLRLLETSHPPTYYLPQEDIAPGVLATGRGSSFCEWKGVASYLDVLVGDDRMATVAWSYPSPTSSYARLKDHVAFYAAPFDACYVDDERVQPQPGGFYGGWVTSLQAGPFKGVPGSAGW